MLKRLTLAAILITPIAPATFFGHQAYTALLGQTGAPWLAVVGGIATAIGLELVGLLAGHTTIEFWRRGDRRAWLAALLLVAYIAIGTVELWRVPVGRAVFLIAGLAYIVAGLRHDAEQVATETAQDRVDDRAEAQELARLRLQYQHEEKLARIQAKATAQAATQNAQNAMSTPQVAGPTAQHSQAAGQESQTAPHYECACGRSFTVPQSYSAHRRHCAVAANGHR